MPRRWATSAGTELWNPVHQTTLCSSAPQELLLTKWGRSLDGVNATHGLKRTNADKANAVRMALAHPNGASISDRQIAEWVGVNKDTVAKYRGANRVTPENPESPATRTGRDGRTIDTTKNP